MYHCVSVCLICSVDSTSHLGAPTKKAINTEEQVSNQNVCTFFHFLFSPCLPAYNLPLSVVHLSPTPTSHPPLIHSIVNKNHVRSISSPSGL